MTISNLYSPQELLKYNLLIGEESLKAQDITAASVSAQKRNLQIDHILVSEYGVPRRKVLAALAAYYDCRWFEYDERVPIPTELLENLDRKALEINHWFPVIKDGNLIVIAAADPSNNAMREEVAARFPGYALEFRVALTDEVLFFISDYLNNPLEDIVGNERTGLAYWRNTMARWRTKLASYRTDYAKVRTHFSLLRGGLGLISIGRSLLHLHPVPYLIPVYWLMISLGFIANILGLYSYLRIKRAILRPPKHETAVEVTAVCLYFLEKYCFVEDKKKASPSKLTMLARLLETLSHTQIDIGPSLDTKDRSALAHERTILAAKRTIAGCYRTIYARSRTGLSFIRTGFAFLGLGIGLMKYFGISYLTILDGFIIISGCLIVVDGIVWYWPVRKEQHEIDKGIGLF